MPDRATLVKHLTQGLAIAGLIAGIGWTGAQFWRTADLVPIPDAPLEAAVRRAANISEGPLTRVHLAQLTEVACAEPVDLAGLQYCASLERLSLGVPHKHAREDQLLAGQFHDWQVLEPSPRPAVEADLSLLTHLPRLIRLSLWGYDLNDLSPVAQFPNLSYLSVTAAPVESFAPLKQLPLLQGLYIQTTKVPDVMPLLEMQSLRELGIASIGGAGSIPYSTELWLPQLPTLQRLELANVGLGECQAIRQLPQLQVVNLSGNAITDLTPFAELRAIRQINLRNNQISDVTALAALVHRNRLRAKEISIDLRGNPLKASCVPHLKNMRALRATVITGKDERLDPGAEFLFCPHWAAGYFGNEGQLMDW